jgi:hypothetical protein
MQVKKITLRCPRHLGSVPYDVGPLVTNAVVAAPFTSNALQSGTSFGGAVVRTGVNYKF